VGRLRRRGEGSVQVRCGSGSGGCTEAVVEESVRGVNENAGALSGEEAIKLRFEFFKQMTTVSTASTVAVIAVFGLSEKVLRGAAGALGWPDWVILPVPGFAIIGFFLSLLTSLVGMYFIAEARSPEEADVRLVHNMLRTSAATFILGVGLSVVTAGLIVAGRQIAPVFLSLAGILILILTYVGIKSSSDAVVGAQQLASGNVGDTTPPLVLSKNPRDKDVDVPPDIHPTVAFSKDMDGATINPNTFKLLDQVTGDQVQPLVRDGVVYDELTKAATFTPAAALENGRRYGATITSGVRDKAGNALPQDQTWHFTVTARQEAAEWEAAG
jgi:hypothetical protein